MTDCIFCKIAQGEVPADRLYENDSFFVIPDANPKVDGHHLVISKKHFVTVLDLPQSTGSELLDAIKHASTLLMDKHQATGLNVVQNNYASSGQVVDHIHFHLLPRKEGDGFSVIE